MIRLPATGKHVAVTAINIGCFVEGKLVELWQEVDDLAMLQQLSMLPAPQPVGS